MSVRFFVSNLTRRVTKRETLWRAFLARRHRTTSRDTLVAVAVNMPRKPRTRPRRQCVACGQFKAECRRLDAGCVGRTVQSVLDINHSHFSAKRVRAHLRAAPEGHVIQPGDVLCLLCSRVHARDVTTTASDIRAGAAPGACVDCGTRVERRTRGRCDKCRRKKLAADINSAGVCCVDCKTTQSSRWYGSTAAERRCHACYSKKLAADINSAGVCCVDCKNTQSSRWYGSTAAERRCRACHRKKLAADINSAGVCCVDCKTTQSSGWYGSTAVERRCEKCYSRQRLAAARTE